MTEASEMETFNGPEGPELARDAKALKWSLEVDKTSGFLGIAEESYRAGWDEALKSISLHPERRDLFRAIDAERTRQILMGYNAEHDDAHGLFEMLGLSIRMIVAEHAKAMVGRKVRPGMVKAASVVFATMESMKRKAGDDW